MFNSLEHTEIQEAKRREAKRNIFGWLRTRKLTRRAGLPLDGLNTPRVLISRQALAKFTNNYKVEYE
jgi:hypothetical protein